MEDKIIKQLYKLRALLPEKGVAERIKYKILDENQAFSFRFFLKSQPIWAKFAMYSVATIIIVSAPLLLSNRAPKLSSLKDAEKLSREVEMLPMSIELKEIEYQNYKNETISAAIAEIKNTNIRHLKKDVIQSEINDFEKETSTEEEINRLLESVTL